MAENPSRFTLCVLRLRIACGNDESLYRRALPWDGLIRDDDYGYPVVSTGSVYMMAGATRRVTGTHYTPAQPDGADCAAHTGTTNDYS